MTRVYERGRLVRIECDGPGCAEAILPGPDIADSGWMKRGFRSSDEDQGCQMDFCPRCWAARDRH